MLPCRRQRVFKEIAPFDADHKSHQKNTICESQHKPEIDEKSQENRFGNVFEEVMRFGEDFFEISGLLGALV